jgi:hypothetical protein
MRHVLYIHKYICCLTVELFKSCVTAETAEDRRSSFIATCMGNARQKQSRGPKAHRAAPVPKDLPVEASKSPTPPRPRTRPKPTPAYKVRDNNRQDDSEPDVEVLDRDEAYNPPPGSDNERDADDVNVLVKELLGPAGAADAKRNEEFDVVKGFSSDSDADSEPEGFPVFYSHISYAYANLQKFSASNSISLSGPHPTYKNFHPTSLGVRFVARLPM